MLAPFEQRKRLGALGKLDSFAVVPGERVAVAGDIEGNLAVVDVESLDVLQVVRAHHGSVSVVAAHRALPYVAALATDQQLSLWRLAGDRLEPVARLSLRGIVVTNDDCDVPYVQSQSQALGFHDSEPRLVTRTANGALLELYFSGGGAIVVHACTRVHDDGDLISARYAVGSDLVLSGSIDGQLVASIDGAVVRRWRLPGTLHWAEHVGGTTYLLASDSRCVARVDITRDTFEVVGPQFTKDDLEHVTYSKVSGRAFVAGFDRNVYELDPLTCSPIGIVYRAPFKCRWIANLDGNPAIILLQCRNGSLIRFDLDGSSETVLRTTPPALWSAARTVTGRLLFAGEGNALYDAGGTEGSCQRLERIADLALPRGSFVKRIVSTGLGSGAILGRTDGKLVRLGVDLQPTSILDLGSAIRDVAAGPDDDTVFAVCENGRAYRVEHAKVAVTAASEGGEPFWSLAYNGRDVLAVAERSGHVLLLDAATLTVRAEGPQSGRPKRMKFIDASTLLLVYRDSLLEFDVVRGTVRTIVEELGNTIEDFLVDGDRELIVCATYNNDLALVDRRNGIALSKVPDQIEYTKGLAWLEPDGPGERCRDFVSFGRAGVLHRYRIHDAKIFALGPLAGETRDSA